MSRIAEYVRESIKNINNLSNLEVLKEEIMLVISLRKKEILEKKIVKSEDFTENFNDFMKKNNLSMYKVSKELGIPYNSIKNWSKGNFVPNKTSQKKILDYINNYNKEH